MKAGTESRFPVELRTTAK